MRSVAVDAGGENVSFTEFVETIKRASGRQGTARRVPLPMMRVASVVMRAIEPGVGASVQVGRHGRRGHDVSSADRARYPAIPVTTLADVVRHSLASQLPEANSLIFLVVHPANSAVGGFGLEFRRAESEVSRHANFFHSNAERADRALTRPSRRRIRRRGRSAAGPRSTRFQWELSGDGSRIAAYRGRQAIQLRTGRAIRRDVVSRTGRSVDMAVTPHRTFVYIQFRVKATTTTGDLFPPAQVQLRHNSIRAECGTVTGIGSCTTVKAQRRR